MERLSRAERARTLVERLLCHEALDRAHIAPRASRMQLLLGSFILDRGGVSHEEGEQVLAALLLIYHGLALHEDVPDGNAAPDKSGQLTVLGGDYYSSLFYRILAEAGRIDLIGRFARAIADMQVAKISLYRFAYSDACEEHRYIADVLTVEGALLRALGETFAPDPRTATLVDAALRAHIYEAEIMQRSGPYEHTLANVLLWSALTPDERREWRTSVRTIGAKRWTSTLHAKYGTLGRLLQGLGDAMNLLQNVAEDMLGYDGWQQIVDILANARAGFDATAFLERG